MTHDKHKPVCPYCGSDAIQGNAIATWDVAAQGWVLVNVTDYAWCTECEDTVEPTWETDV